jgi:hypothetical protein
MNADGAEGQVPEMHMVLIKVGGHPTKEDECSGATDSPDAAGRPSRSTSTVRCLAIADTEADVRSKGDLTKAGVVRTRRSTAMR